jgi:hypothetical protein
MRGVCLLGQGLLFMTSFDAIFFDFDGVRSEKLNLNQPMAGLREHCELKHEGETNRTVGPNDSNRKDRLASAQLRHCERFAGRSDLHQLRLRCGSSSSACRPNADAAALALSW